MQSTHRRHGGRIRALPALQALHEVQRNPATIQRARQASSGSREDRPRREIPDDSETVDAAHWLWL